MYSTPPAVSPSLVDRGIASANASDSRVRLGVALVLLLNYGIWLLAFWPGILGEDSLSVMLEVDGHQGHLSGKPLAWVLFIRGLYGGTGHTEVAVAVQVLLMALMMSRILAWVWAQGLHKSAVALAVLVCLAPHMSFFATTLYPDALFAVATVAFLFECWRVAQTRTLTVQSALVLFFVFPLAVFLRANGMASLLGLLVAGAHLKNRQRFWLLAMAVMWLAAHAVATTQVRGNPQSALFPLVLHETVNFVQPRPSNLWANRQPVRESTLQVLTARSDLATVQRFYDRDYWDPLIFHPDGPRLGALSEAERDVLIRDFFEHNLWVNLPAFFSSRVNIFLSASLGHGGFPDVGYSRYVLPRTQAESRFRLPISSHLEPFARASMELSFAYRYLLWSPLWGMVLLVLVGRQALVERQHAHWAVVVPMAAQLGGIVLFSTAAEYRYLLPLFLAPLCLWPMWLMGRRAAMPD